MEPTDAAMSDAARDERRLRLLRVLLYGSPVIAALLTVCLRQAMFMVGVTTWWLDGAVTIANGGLTALASAAGAVWLPNRLAIRIAHAMAAAFLSVVIYVLLLSIAASLLP